MTTLLNLLWFILGGFLGWLSWVLLSGVLAITVVGIPFAQAAFRISKFVAFPFGKELVDVRLMGEERIPGTELANFLWIILAGLWLTIFHLITGISACLTIIGIPFGIAHFRLAKVSFSPLGKKPVSTKVAKEVRNKEQKRIN